MRRIGIYGGSFNPPHVGHISAAKQAMEALRLDTLLLIPAGIAPHKVLPENSPTAAQRLEMVRLSVIDCPQMEASDIELKEDGTSYTYRTVLALREKYPEDSLVLLMGTDMFLSFESWKNPDIILENVTLGVLYRGEKGEAEAVAQKKRELESKGAAVELVENDAVQISSTDLRRMLAFGCAKPYLPAGIWEYIISYGLYGTGANRQGLSEKELEKTVTALLKPNRVAHVLGCRDTAVQLAKRWGANETDAARAGLLHDITKALDGPLQLTLCREYGILLDAFSAKNPKTLHALTGCLVAERIFGENNAVVSAVRHHTTGKADMDLLEKIIYVADYMEPNRDFPGVEKLRSLAFSDLDGALKLGLSQTIDMLTRQGRDISEESKQAIAWLNRKDGTQC